MLKKLVMEFKDELDALGVKVDKLDKRVAVLEDRLGGWKLRGTFEFTANWAGGDGDRYAWNDGYSTQFNKDKFYLVLTKQIDENTSLYARFRAGGYPNPNSIQAGKYEMNESQFDQVYVNTKLPWDVAFRVGRFGFDLEGEKGLYYGNDRASAFVSSRVDGFRFKKAWGTNFQGTLAFLRNSAHGWTAISTNGLDGAQSTLYVGDLMWTPNEKFFVGASAYVNNADTHLGAADKGESWQTYTGYMGYKFTPAVELKGAYYWQKLNDIVADNVNSPKYWKIALDVKQDLLKFTSLWVEYAQRDNTFNGAANYATEDMEAHQTIVSRPGSSGTRRLASFGARADGTTKIFYIGADQKWNKKWSSWVRYTQADYDTVNIDDAKAWGVGAKYQYTPAIAFSLSYNSIDWGDRNIGLSNGAGKDNVFTFRTAVQF